jgi:hypothetical protein
MATATTTGAASGSGSSTVVVQRTALSQYACMLAFLTVIYHSSVARWPTVL